MLNNHLVAAVSAAIATRCLPADLVRRRTAHALVRHGRRIRGVRGRRRTAGAVAAWRCSRRRCWPATGARWLHRLRARRSRRRRRVLRHELRGPRELASRRTCTAARPTPATTGTPTSTRWTARERASYWLDPQGIDRGEPSELTYALHVLVGHHGVFSLTPVWLLSVWGAWLWLRARDLRLRQIAAGVALHHDRVPGVLHRAAAAGGSQLRRHDRGLPLAVLAGAAVAAGDDSRGRPRGAVADRNGDRAGAARVLGAVGELPDVEPVDAAVDLQLAERAA